MRLPINQVLCGDAIEVMKARIPDNSIDLVVTSPPYWGLRDYGSETVRVWGGNVDCEHEWGITLPKGGRTKRLEDGDPKQSKDGIAESFALADGGIICSKCGAWRGSLGLEPHPQMFIVHLAEICREIKRILKPTGTFWLNLGDTYYGKVGWEYSNYGPNRKKRVKQLNRKENLEKSNWLRPKQKLMIPSRVAIALQHDGWILRSDIIWYKPNAMPSSVKDRLTCAYEHVFLFAKQRSYYFDLDAIRKPTTSSPPWSSKSSKDPYQQNNPRRRYDGKFKADIAETLASPRARQSTRESTSYYHPEGKNPGDLWRISTTPFPGAHFATFPPKLVEPIIKAGSSRGGVVLDPFGGSGTVGQVARKLGRRFILIEIIPEYCEMAEQRVRGKYKSIPEGLSQLTLFMETKKDG